MKLAVSSTIDFSIHAGSMVYTSPRERVRDVPYFVVLISLRFGFKGKLKPLGDFLLN